MKKLVILGALVLGLFPIWGNGRPKTALPPGQNHYYCAASMRVSCDVNRHWNNGRRV